MEHYCAGLREPEAVLPLLWFCCTAQPIAIHYWYQYRSIALTHWAVGTYVTMTFWQGNVQTELRIEKSLSDPFSGGFFCVSLPKNGMISQKTLDF